MNQPNRALMDYSQAVRLEPQVAKHYSKRGLCFRKLGRIDEALVDYNDAIKLGQEVAQYYFERALVYIDLEQYDHAVSDFTSALDRRLGSTLFKALFHRGVCYRWGNLKSKSKFR